MGRWGEGKVQYDLVRLNLTQMKVTPHPNVEGSYPE
jgi:hypothetical protein